MLLFRNAFPGEGEEKIFLFLSTIVVISALRGRKLGSSLIPFRQSPWLKFTKVVDFDFGLPSSVFPLSCYLTQ